MCWLDLAEVEDKRQMRRTKQSEESKKSKHIVQVQYVLAEEKLDAMTIQSLNEQIAKYRAFECALVNRCLL